MAPRQPLSPSATDELWLRMASRYGHAWVSQYGAAPQGIAGAEWRSTLGALTAAQLREGFAADERRGSDWPPSSTTFRAMALGIPTLAVVRAGLSAKEPTRFVRQVWQHIDRYRFLHADQREGDRLLAEAYELARLHVMDGGELPPAPEALIEHTEPTRTPASPETVRAHMDAIAAKLAVTDDPPDVPETGMEASL